MKQRTIRTQAGLSGVGLHTGNLCNLTFRPAPAGAGIAFVRSDLPGSPRIPADVAHVVGLDRGTSLGIDGAKVHTVEHVLAAIAALGIDNLDIEVDANEPPVGDGSALPFFLTLKRAGLVSQDRAREVFSLSRPFHYSEGDVQFTLVPSAHFQVTFSIDFDHPLIGHQYASFEITPDSFERELAPARTFGFLHEVAELKEAGLILGGSLENAIVLGEGSILNAGELRFPNEFVRHKMLDLIGDLSLFGREIRAHVISNRSGHKTNVDLVNALGRIARQEANGDRTAPADAASKGTAARAGSSGTSPPTLPARALSGEAEAGPGEDERATRRRDAPRPGSPPGSGGPAGNGGDGVPDRPDEETSRRRAPFGVDEILELLPHRFPFLLVDRVLELEPLRRIVGLKNVTVDEPFFVGHFPGRPIMPGVLIVEAMGQVGGLLMLNSYAAPERKLVYFTGLDGVKFRRPVVPGDQLRIEIDLVKLRGRACRMSGVAYVDGARVAEATMTAVVVDRAPAAGSS